MDPKPTELYNWRPGTPRIYISEDRKSLDSKGVLNITPSSWCPYMQQALIYVNPSIAYIYFLSVGLLVLAKRDKAGGNL